MKIDFDKIDWVKAKRICPRCHNEMSPAPMSNGDGTHHYSCDNCYYESDYTQRASINPAPRNGVKEKE